MGVTSPEAPPLPTPPPPTQPQGRSGLPGRTGRGWLLLHSLRVPVCEMTEAVRPISKVPPLPKVCDGGSGQGGQAGASGTARSFLVELRTAQSELQKAWIMAQFQQTECFLHPSARHTANELLIKDLEEVIGPAIMKN